jgi:hypothetical protein
MAARGGDTVAGGADTAAAGGDTVAGDAGTAAGVTGASGADTVGGGVTGVDTAGSCSDTLGGGTSSAMACCRQKHPDNSDTSNAFFNICSLLLSFLILIQPEPKKYLTALTTIFN